jgi:hypothetical protein
VAYVVIVNGTFLYAHMYSWGWQITGLVMSTVSTIGTYWLSRRPDWKEKEEEEE